MALEVGTASPTKAVAEYVARASYDDLPPEVRRAVAGFIMDSIANMIGGARIAAGKIVLETFGELGGRPESTILATGTAVPCLHATYVNAALSNMLDFDDCYLYVSHPGATIIPAALSLGEKLGVSGKELINAVVLGYEVSLRVCDAFRPLPERFEEVWGMATWQIFGAVTAAAKLLEFGAGEVATAFGHAGMNAPVPFLRKFGLEEGDRPCSWIKNNFGWAAMGGVLAADLASRGFHGNQNIFDGPKGFWRMMGSDRCDFARLTSGLGEEYLLLANGIKPYASCRRTHTTLDAVYEILAKNTLDPERIAAVFVRSTTGLFHCFNVPSPADVIDAQFAIPPLVALALAGYSPAHGIAEEHLGDPLVQGLIAKVTVEVDPEADRGYYVDRQMPSTVVVEMVDGTRFAASQAIAKGEAQRPFTEAELKDKFLDLTVPVAGERRARRILSAVERLEELDNVASIVAE